MSCHFDDPRFDMYNPMSVKCILNAKGTAFTWMLFTREQLYFIPPVPSSTSAYHNLPLRWRGPTWRNMYNLHNIRRPRPSPRPGRRLGPPQVWNFSFLAFQGQTTSRKPSPGMRHPPVQISRHLDMKIICFGQVSFPAENLVFQVSSQSSRSRIPVVAVQVIDLMKTAGPVLCLPCGHQTREGACAGFTCARPSARALNVRGSFHQVPGRQRSSIAACPLPAHSPVLLGHSSLPFASLQTLKTPKTPKTLHRRCGQPRHLPPPLPAILCCMAS